MRSRTLLDSFNYAFSGIIYALETQRNIRLHFGMTIALLFASLFFHLNKMEVLMLFITIGFVIITEMINTAIEATIDLITKEYNPLAAIAKNVAAGAVLVASLIATVVGILIFFAKIDRLVPKVHEALRGIPVYLSLVALLITMVLVIVGKAWTKTGTPLKGGMPSGHAALSTSIATTVFFLSQNSVIIFLVILLTFLVMESRVAGKIHSVVEVLLGGLLGILVTFLIFRLWIP